ncbi:MAG TPA: 30S ribosomal protein S2 [Candidatus Nanoarchaeia archaeon]|nr:30S ribosomal protein S2 [Candidatus Nanoarchaeia archaeon]
MAKLPTIEAMLEAGMHFGHSASKWHPKMKPYIFTERKGVYIIDLAKSQKMLGTALEFMENLTKESKTILFVGTKNQVKKDLRATAEAVGMPYISEKWSGGILTNFPIIKKMINKYKSLSEEKALGKLDRYTKKERSEFDKEIKRLELKVGGLTNLNKLPDALFVWDIKKEKTALNEARIKNIPIVAICDTNSNPDLVNYVIPGNDDASKTVKLIMDCVKENLLEAKNEIKTK